MKEDKRHLIIAAIPAYNEEKTIPKTVLLTQKYVDRVVICDDGSTDLTAEIAERLGAEVLRHDRNCGYGAALSSLFRKAREMSFDVLVTLDGDGQHNPSEIPTLVKPIFEGKADVVIGSRFLGDQENGNNVPRVRRAGIKAITKLTQLASNHKLSDAQSGFRAYSQKALDCLDLNENGMGASVEVLMEAKKKGLRVLEVPANCNYQGLEKTSNHHPISHGVGVVMAIVRLVVEERPLLFLGLPGFLSFVGGLVLGAWMLQVYTATQYVATNVALASVAFVLVGFLMISTAVTLYAIMRLAQKMRVR